MGLIQEHPRIRVTPRRLRKEQARNWKSGFCWRLATQNPHLLEDCLVVSGNASKVKVGWCRVAFEGGGGSESERGRDEDDRTSLLEKAGTGLWPVRCWVTDASRLGMPGVGRGARRVMVMEVQN